MTNMDKEASSEQVVDWCKEADRQSFVIDGTRRRMQVVSQLWQDKDKDISMGCGAA